MTRIGYIRTSTADQNLAVHIAALKAAGCEVIREEQKSGTSLGDRSQLHTILDPIHPGETLVVTRIDRLARSLRDLQLIVDRIKTKGTHLFATEQSVDASTAAGKALFRHARRLCPVREEPPARASGRGDRGGQEAGRLQGPPTEDRPQRNSTKAQAGSRPTQIARDLGISRGTVYQVRKGR